MSSWNLLTPPRPPAAANGRASTAYDPERGLLLVHPEDRGQLWRWTGRSWELLSRGLMEEHFSTRPLIAWGLQGDTWILVPADGELWVTRLGAPGVRRFPAPGVDAYASHGLAGYDPERGVILVHVNDDDEGRTFALDGQRLEPLTTGPYLLSGCFDPGRGQLVGVDISGIMSGLRGSSWEVVGGVSHYTSSDIAYDPGLGGLIHLVARDDHHMQLFVERGGSFEPLPREMRPLMASAMLAADPGHDQLISFGGQDFRSSGDASDHTWISEGGDFIEQSDALDLLLGRHATPGVADGRLTVVNHSTLSVDVLEAGGWRTLIQPHTSAGCGGADVYDLSVNFAVDEAGIAMLDGDGGLWRARAGAGWERLAPAGAGPSSHYARRVAMACHDDRIVVHGGVEQNSTWIFSGGAWRELDAIGGPPAGIHSMAATPAGLYLLTGADLWRLEEARWACVGSDPAWEGQHLRYEPRRGLLLSVSGDRLGAWARGRWVPLVQLPEDPQIVFFGSGSAELGVDPVHDRLVLLDRDGTLGLALSELELPAGELPTEPTTASVTTRAAPDHLKRRAAAIVPTEGPSTTAAQLGIEVPQGWSLLAALPAHPEIPGLGDWPGVAVLVADWELCDQRGWQPWQIEGGGIAIRRIEAPEHPWFLAGADGDQLQPARYELFEEIDPEEEGSYASLPGNAHRRSLGTKLGGYPRYVQHAPSLPPDARFLLQLSPELFDCAFGDVGSLYAWRSGSVGLALTQGH